ncbi:DHA2 family efflux MFS transporter permease subunit [Peribacillus asahii]|uniref:Lincomycin resistance protein LmrB n=1 Tax=Peribacillus asahii TaxID=228899 RepID=A0A3Q9RRT3_9BACI|nr:DHA2 family efflux MFS transporter permease subunit [Peribacillus asahii]AZV45158.1 lincomycin resistance protein LmrB [Peribacillus asahii]USK84764.1 DHA2 family efflux MFS transporter permease subunit [Peribacillus asahii]
MQAQTQEKTQQEERQYRTFPILLSFLIAGFIGLFSETALNIALNDLIQIFAIQPSTVQWLTTGYLLTLGILVPVSGLLLQWFTTRQLFITSLIFSIIGTLIAALAPSFEILLVARVIQAIGTALLLPLMFNTILLIFPIHKRGSIMGLIGLVIMFAPAIGPTISGLVIANLSWHWIFWLALPFFALSLICGIMFMENVSTITKPKIDIVSIILSTFGFGGVVYGFSVSGEGEGWGSSKVIIALLVGIIALILFTIRQLSMQQPMMNLRAFKFPMFTLGVILLFIGMMTILSSMIMLPLYLQSGLALSAFAAGLVLLPGGILNGFMSPVMGRLFDKYGPRWLVIPGMVIVTIVLWLFSSVSMDTAITFVVALHIFLMIGVSMIMMPAQTNGLNQLPPQFYPDGTAIMNTLQQVAGAIGTAVAITIMSAGQKSYMSNVTNPNDPLNAVNSLNAGIQDAFVFALIVSVIGLICALFIKRVNVEQKN